MVVNQEVYGQAKSLDLQGFFPVDLDAPTGIWKGLSY